MSRLTWLGFIFTALYYLLPVAGTLFDLAFFGGEADFILSDMLLRITMISVKFVEIDFQVTGFTKINLSMISVPCLPAFCLFIFSLNIPHSHLPLPRAFPFSRIDPIHT